MTVSASTIKVGKCYVTGLSEHRRVMEVTVTKVTYEIIGNNKDESRAAVVSREKFAAEVDREVACPD